MTEIRRKLGASALALALALGGLAGAGCVDHSGDKTYPRPADGAATDTAADAPVSDDAPATSDAPVSSDTATADTHPDTTTTGDTHPDTGSTSETGTSDASLGDVRVDLGTGG
jgi:hypothetical protein